MNRNPPERSRPELVRTLAAERLRRRSKVEPAALSPEQLRELVHELQVREIELEIQNEELQKVQAAAEEARDRHRALYESVPVGFVTVGTQGMVEEANPTVLGLLGVTLSELVGRKFSDFIAPASQQAWRLLRRRLADLAGPESCELRLEGSDGRTSHVEVVAVHEAKGVGAPGPSRLAMVDVTERRDAERALRAAASQAALAEHRERRQLAVDLHDDLGQTLSLASLKLKRVASASEEEKEQSLHEISRLLEEARERVTSLSFQISPPILYDVGLVAAAEWLAEDLERRYGLIVSIARGDEPETDEATRITLYRALRELLINVAKHSGVREAHVRIWQDAHFARLEVIDGGKGFDPVEARRGFGLLALRERVAHLGGNVTISSENGGGAQVRISVPRADAPEVRTRGSSA